jgi:hypothetical protein
MTTGWSERAKWAATIALALALAPAVAVAQPPVSTTAPSATAVSAQVFVIVAREVAGAIDPRLTTLHALHEPPFSAFHSMDILGEHSLMLEPGTPVTVDLPNGRVIQLVLEEITPDGRNHVRVSINRPSESDYLPVLEVAAPPGDPFFVAGQNYMGGTLIIGVSLGRVGADTSGRTFVPHTTPPTPAPPRPAPPSSAPPSPAPRH